MEGGRKISDSLFAEVAVLCEDVREEKTRKVSLIGVFGGDVVVPQFPAQIRIAFYITLRSTIAGERQLNVSLRIGDEMTFNSDVPMVFEAKNPAANLIIPGAILKVDKEGYITLLIGVDGQQAEVLSKRVFVGEITG